MSNVDPKRKQQDDPDLLEFNSEIDRLLLKLQQKGGLDLAAYGILDMARRAHLTLTDLKSVRLWPPHSPMPLGARLHQPFAWINQEISISFLLSHSPLLRFLHHSIRNS
jgi:hypothetical protein